MLASSFSELTFVGLLVTIGGGSPESRTLISPPCKRGAMPLGERTMVAVKGIEPYCRAGYEPVAAPC